MAPEPDIHVPLGTAGSSGTEVPPDEVEQEVTDYLTVAEVAALAGITDRAVRKRIAQGKLAAVREADGSWRVPADAAHAYARPGTGSGTSSSDPGTSGSVPPGTDSSGGTAVPQPSPEIFAAAFSELLHRHEAALVRLGQLEATRERLQLTAGDLEDQLTTARARIAELEALVPNPAPTTEPDTAEPISASEPARRPWWSRLWSKSATRPDAPAGGASTGAEPTA
jgi:excisionase family DNA binding protein